MTFGNNLSIETNLSSGAGAATATGIGLKFSAPLAGSGTGTLTVSSLGAYHSSSGATYGTGYGIVDLTGSGSNFQGGVQILAGQLDLGSSTTAETVDTVLGTGTSAILLAMFQG